MRQRHIFLLTPSSSGINSRSLQIQLNAEVARTMLYASPLQLQFRYTGASELVRLTNVSGGTLMWCAECTLSTSFAFMPNGTLRPVFISIVNVCSS